METKFAWGKFNFFLNLIEGSFVACLNEQPIKQGGACLNEQPIKQGGACLNEQPIKQGGACLIEEPLNRVVPV